MRVIKNCLVAVIICISSFAHAQNQSLADSLVKIYENGPEDSLKNEILYGIAIYHTNQDSTIYYASELIKHASIDSQFFYLQSAHLNIGHAFQRKGDLDKALSSYFKSEIYARKTGRSTAIGVSFVAIGDVYSANENRDNAFLYYNRAIEILRAPTDSVPLATALLNTGSVYLQYDVLDTALIYFQESGEIFKLQNYEIGTAYNLGNVGLVYAKQGKNELAEETLNKATLILEKLGDRYPIASFNITMAGIYQNNGEFSRALVFANHSLQIGEEEGLKEQIRDACLKLSELYGLIEDYKNAYKYQSQYITYRDSINNNETIQNMADMRTEYEVSQKQIEVDLLEQEKRIQQIVSYAMAAVILLIIILVIVLYRTSRQKQHINELLSRQKAIVETQRDLLEGLNKTKDRFFSIISHDLRGPVNAFAGVAELIRHYIKDKAYDDLAEVTEHIDQSSSQLSGLLDNLLNWAVSQQGEFPYTPEQVNISEMTTELNGIFKNMSSAKNIEMVFDIPASTLAWVDRNSTMTIFRNLIGNALKFTKSNGVITLSAATSETQTIITVQDTGVGIPQEKLITLFQLLEKKSTWGTDGEKGLGLGLQLVYEFAALNQGSIGVESEVGVGTSFRVTLPCRI